VPLNANFTNTDQALGGTQAFNLAGASGTVNVSGTVFVGSYPANTASYIPLIWSLTGTLTSNVNLQVPSGVGGQWIVNNACTGAFTITVSSAAGGTTVVVPQSSSRAVAINSSGAFFANTAAASPTMTVISSDVPSGSAISLSSGATGANITSIPITAGTWMCGGNVQTLPSGSTQTLLVSGWISQVSASPSAGFEAIGGFQLIGPGSLAPNTPIGSTVGPVFYTVAAPTTVYLGVSAAFSSGGLRAYGLLNAVSLLT